MASDKSKYLSFEKVSECSGASLSTVEKWMNKVQRGPHKNNNKVALEEFILFLKENSNVTSITRNKNAPKVLVIDGEKKTTESIGEIFSTHGFDVLSTPDAIKAGGLITYEKPHIVTLDLSLENFDGTDVLKIINGLKLTEKIWVIVISADSEENLQKAVDLGADCYLQKPFSEQDLKKIINKFFPEQTTLAKAA